MIYKKLFPVCLSLAVMAMGAQDLYASASVSGDRLERQVVMMEKMLTPSFPEAMIPASLKRLDELMKNENLTPGQAQRLEIVKAALEQKMGGAPKAEAMAPAVMPGTGDVDAQMKVYIQESALIAGAPKKPGTRQRLDTLRPQVDTTMKVIEAQYNILAEKKKKLEDAKADAAEVERAEKDLKVVENQLKEIKGIQTDLEELDAIVPKARL